jgi:hypothetical protein
LSAIFKLKINLQQFKATEIFQNKEKKTYYYKVELKKKSKSCIFEDDYTKLQIAMTQIRD